MFKYEEKGHKYTYDDKPMTGVTTILGMVAKPALISWAANMATDYCSQKIESGKEYTEDELAQIFTDAKKAHITKRDSAASKGTDVHALLEEILKKAIKETGGIIPDQVSEHPQVSHFLVWAKKYNVKFLASEEKVYSLTHFYAGTLDFICEIEGKVYLGDIKTSSGVYGRSFFAQCAAYRLAYEEMGTPFTFEGSLIIRIGKDGKFNEEKDALISLDYEDDKRFFLAALELYRQENMFEATAYKPKNK